MSPAARLRLFYLLYYGAVGANLPYFAAYLRGLGFSGEQIGTVQMMGPIVAAPVAIAWATIADRVGAPSRALSVAALWSVAAAAFLPVARTPIALAAVVLLQSFAERAVVPLADSVTLEWTRARRGTSYASIRLFGSLGFIALAEGLGLLLSARGDRAGDVAVPLTVVACVAGYALAAQRLPSPPAHLARPSGKDALALARDPRLVAILLACAVHWMGCAPFHLMFGVFIRDERLPASLTGLAMAAGVGAEVVGLLGFPWLERRFGVRALFAIAFAGTAVRWFLLSGAHGAAPIVLLQLFHGLTFGVFWGASMRALSERVPPSLRATGQALYSAVVFGGGNAAGYQLAGIGYDRLGGVRPLFLSAAALEVVLLAATLAAPRLMRATPAEAASDG
jgi:MFS transporter, PPP family, 3-phenylpropionic acid transporter